MRLEKTKALFHSRYGTIKIPPFCKALLPSIDLDFAARHP
jgi:hypothetical protein